MVYFEKNSGSVADHAGEPAESEPD